jgi:hypothetical protein
MLSVNNSFPHRLNAIVSNWTSRIETSTLGHACSSGAPRFACTLIRREIRGMIPLRASPQDADESESPGTAR